MKLEDGALSGVNGGVVIQKKGTGNAVPGDTKKKECPVCDKETVFRLFTGGRAVCTICGYQINNA